ncbi:hypothetical protein CGJ40_23115 [Vibrio parahaemolyticus]|nr:hypothetical protein BTM22_24670 [Vibrio parahaemolyticus]TOE56423.1 hypothetical protein CGJ40_23115 [Vibrio parahaemolyticus]
MNSINDFASLSSYHLNNLLWIFCITVFYLLFKLKKDKVIPDFSRTSLKIVYIKSSQLSMSYFCIYAVLVYLAKLALWLQ